MNVIGILGTIVAILVSVMLHEAGHFLAAKRFGMKATKFFVGFGPTLFSFRRGETEYGIKAIPAGGFVKIIGMTQLEEIEPGDEHRVFYSQPAPQRALVLAAGSLVHLVLATIIVFGVLATAGNLNADGGLAVRTVNACVPVQETATTCTTGDLPSPARGVLQAGDHVLAVAGTPTPTSIAALTAIRARPDLPTQIVVERAGHRVSVELTPVPVVRSPLVGSGKPSRVGAIGVTTTQLTQHYSVLGAVPETFRVLGTFATGTWTVLHHLPSEVANLLAGRPRTGAGPASVIDIARISGDIAAAPGVPASQRLGTILLLIADLNFFIGLFNALPLLPLDGGHLAILGFEEGRRRLYGLVGRRDPGRVDLMKVMPVVYAFLAVFIGLSLLLLYAGVANPIRLQ